MTSCCCRGIAHVPPNRELASEVEASVTVTVTVTSSSTTHDCKSFSYHHHYASRRQPFHLKNMSPRRKMRQLKPHPSCPNLKRVTTATSLRRLPRWHAMRTVRVAKGTASGHLRPKRTRSRSIHATHGMFSVPFAIGSILVSRD